MEELERVRAGDVFGSSLDLTAGGLQDLPPDTLIPGIAVASTRATPLAGEKMADMVRGRQPKEGEGVAGMM